MRTAIFATAAALTLAACTGADVDDTAEVETIESERTEVLSDEAYGSDYDSDYDTELENDLEDLGNDIEYGTDRAIDETDDALEEVGDELEEAGDEIEDDLDDPM